MIRHHPAPELLLDYATGSTPEALSLIVACHATRCTPCRADVNRYEDIGAALLETLEPAPADEALLTAVMARLDEPQAQAQAGPPVLERQALREKTGAKDRVIPPPLRPYLGGSVDTLPWRRVGRLFHEARLPLPSKTVIAKLMRFSAGSVMPVHTHRGHEYTMVLSGAYKDGDDRFVPGDFDARDATHRHQPKIEEEEDCLALVVVDAPVKLTGMFGRLLNPFLRT